MRISILISSLGILCSCSVSDKAIDVTVENQLSGPRKYEMGELPSDSILDLLGTAHCYVTDSDGKEIPSQITHDGLLIFQADVDGNGSATYSIHPSDTMPVYSPVAVGRIYPERADDIAWENEFVGFRAYGPTTQAKGEKAFGYDIFFKHSTKTPVLEKLYEPETNPRTWEIRDSLLSISKELADSFVNTISYHIDHGMGMDCYAVGPTLGAGVAALTDNDTICYAWCYKDARVLDNGPLRFTVKMDFAPVVIGSDSCVSESRVITLDAGSHLNRCDVTYAGLTAPHTIVAGFPIRDENTPLTDPSKGIVVYADPTQGPDNGKALLGIIMPGANGTLSVDNHITATSTILPNSTLRYYWGFAWDRTDISDKESWLQYLCNRESNISSPLKISINH